MSGFFGWTGLQTQPDQPHDLLSRMAHAARFNNIKSSVVKDNLALSVSGGVYPVTHFANDEICTVVMGRPRWLDPGLSARAKESNDASALAMGWMQFDTSVLDRMAGSFSFVVMQKGRTVAAIDRYGIHSLCYAHVSGGLIFSTHAEAVAAHPLVQGNIDHQALYNYFHFHVIPSPGTLFREIRRLQPAQSISLKDKQLGSSFYHRHQYSPVISGSFDDKKQKLHHLLEQAVARQLQGQKAAAFLSGGLDSSTVSGYLSKLQADVTDTFSIGFAHQDFDEMEYVHIAARQFNLNSHEYYLQPQDIVDAIPIIAGTYDEPFANNSAVPTYFCAKKAHEDGFDLMFAGDGGDEIFGGNARYAKQMLFEHYHLAPVWLRKALIEPVAFSAPFSKRLTPLRKLQSYIQQANVPLPDRLETYNLLNRQSLSEMFEPEFLSVVDTKAPIAALRESYFDTNSEHPVNRMLNLDMKFTLADNDLRKVVCMAEAAGVEVAFPMLDDDVVTFSCGLPPSDKVHGQTLRWFYKKAMLGFLPEAIINKSKHGFGLPFGPWVLSHKPLKELVYTRLDELAKRQWIRSDYIQALKKQHAEVHPVYYGTMIWILVMLEEWLQTRKL